MESIIRQGSFLIFAQVLTRAVSFFYTIFLARSLGVSDFGLYSVALAYFSIVSSVADFGINKFLTREVAKDRSNISYLLWNVVFIRLILTSIIFAVFSVVLYLLDADKMRVSMILLATLAILPQAVALTFDAIFVAIQKLQFSALALIFSSVFTALIGFILISLGFGPFGAVNALIIGQVIFVLVLFIVLLKYRHLGLSPFGLPVIKKIIKGSLPYGVLGIIGVISFKIDTPILSYFKGNYETGIYSVAYKFFEAVNFIPIALSIASFPIFVKSVEKDSPEIRKLYFKSIKIMFLLGVLVMLIYVLILPEIMRFLLPNYLPSLEVLKILALSIPLIFIHIPSNQLLLSQDKYLKHLLVIYFALFLVNLILYLYFIPRFGSFGAAWVTVLSEFTTFTVFFLYLIFKVFKTAK